MRDRFIFSIMILLLSIFIGSNAMAAGVFSLSTDYQTGDTSVEYTLSFTADESDVLWDYDLGFFFDETELSYMSHGYNDSLIGISGEPMFVTPATIGNGTIDGYYAGSFSGLFDTGLSVSTGETVVLGFVQFGISSNAVLDGQTDFGFNYGAGGYDYFSVIFESGPLDVNTNTFPNPILDVGTASAVPVPSAILLLGASLLGLAGIRRKTA